VDWADHMGEARRRWPLTRLTNRAGRRGAGPDSEIHRRAPQAALRGQGCMRLRVSSLDHRAGKPSLGSQQPVRAERRRPGDAVSPRAMAK